MPIPDELIRCELQGGSTFGSQWVNVLWFVDLTGPTSLARLDLFLTHWDTGADAATAYCDNLNDNYLIQGVRVTAPGLTPPLEAESSAPNGGTGTGDPAPPNVAICVSLGTGLAGRSYRGRTYLPPIADSAITDGGYMSSENVEGIAANYILMQEAMLEDDFGQVVWSPLLEEAHAITTVTVSPRVDTQKRRLQRLPG